MVKLLQKYHYEKNYFYSVGGGRSPPSPPLWIRHWTAQTAEVAEIVHILNTLEIHVSRASSRVNSRLASPVPYLSGTTTQVRVLSAGALFPQDHLVNRSVNPNSTTDVLIFSTSVCEGPDTLSLGPRRNARLQNKLRPDYRHY